MDITRMKPSPVSQAFDEAVGTLTRLENSLSGSYGDPEYFDKARLDDACAALKKLSALIEKGEASGEEWVNRKKNVLSAVERLSDSSKLTALGTMQAELSGILRTMMKIITREGAHRVKKTEFDRLDKRG